MSPVSIGRGIKEKNRQTDKLVLFKQHVSKTKADKGKQKNPAMIGQKRGVPPLTHCSYSILKLPSNWGKISPHRVPPESRSDWASIPRFNFFFREPVTVKTEQPDEKKGCRQRDLV